MELKYSACFSAKQHAAIFFATEPKKRHRAEFSINITVETWYWVYFSHTSQIPFLCPMAFLRITAIYNFTDEYYYYYTTGSEKIKTVGCLCSIQCKLLHNV